MNKNLMYSSDFIWYDESIYDAIMNLGEEYPNAIPVFGGALGAFNAIESGDFDRFEVALADAVDNAKFYNWHESSAEVARRFCELCYIDPMLIEVGYGARFEEIFK